MCSKPKTEGIATTSEEFLMRRATRLSSRFSIDGLELRVVNDLKPSGSIAIQVMRIASRFSLLARMPKFERLVHVNCDGISRPLHRAANRLQLAE
ncbi:hypothetical protein CA13_04680 [Planctomycetes bacterium CA13]|uniref:Uncharacterized protein n=1 Tax=Novipirellula herctigrandis TaxID=2527986 RepID=A0A5C5YWC5_9BACT|nr:hypothetical protein CA13_04680 [Planctomycetes bacterium CA13]